MVRRRARIPPHRLEELTGHKVTQVGSRAVHTLTLTQAHPELGAGGLRDALPRLIDKSWSRPPVPHPFRRYGIGEN